MNRSSPIARSVAVSTEHTVTEAVVEAIAEAKEVSPMEVSPPLGTVIDPDALEAFVGSVARRSADSDGYVEFGYSGYKVTVGSDGQVDVAASDD